MVDHEILQAIRDDNSRTRSELTGAINGVRLSVDDLIVKVTRLETLREVDAANRKDLPARIGAGIAVLGFLITYVFHGFTGKP